MIEIIVIIAFVGIVVITPLAFSAHLSKVAEERRRTPKWAWLGVGMWFGGVIAGQIVGLIISDQALTIFATALIGAVIGAIIADRHVHNLPIDTQPAQDAPVAAAPVVSQSRHQPCRQCGNVILVGVDTCPFCKASQPHSG
jgi:MFS family permease